MALIFELCFLIFGILILIIAAITLILFIYGSFKIAKKADEAAARFYPEPKENSEG